MRNYRNEFKNRQHAIIAEYKIGKEIILFFKLYHFKIYWTNKNFSVIYHFCYIGITNWQKLDLYNIDAFVLF